jgi:hypothetical protein
MDLREIGWDGMDWLDLAQDRDQWRALVNTVAAGRFYSFQKVVTAQPAEMCRTELFLKIPEHIVA